MRALIVYCHPKPDSFTAAVREVVVERLAGAGAQIRVRDLYGRGFDPVLTPAEFDGYLDSARNAEVIAEDIADLRWCDTLIFVYPTWWYGLPAMLKGWLDRVLLPEVAFLMPDAENATIRPGLTHVERLGVYTTCGASWWLTRIIGAPGRRTILRGVRALCAKGCRTGFAAHYLMDSSTGASRARHLSLVAASVDRLAGRRRVRRQTGEATA